tara:strand:- start:235 stop:786 length:552 start_codon:yes stop_codon:yes gene_type:complete
MSSLTSEASQDDSDVFEDEYFSDDIPEANEASPSSPGKRKGNKNVTIEKRQTIISMAQMKISTHKSAGALRVSPRAIRHHKKIYQDDGALRQKEWGRPRKHFTTEAEDKKLQAVVSKCWDLQNRRIIDQTTNKIIRKTLEEDHGIKVGESCLRENMNRLGIKVIFNFLCFYLKTYCFLHFLFF